MIDFERRRDTRQAAQFLTDLGFRTAPATLNKLRCIGGGPEFELFGRRPIYSGEITPGMGNALALRRAAIDFGHRVGGAKNSIELRTDGAQKAVRP